MKFLTMILMMGVLGACAQSVRLGSVVMKDVIAVTNELDATAIAALNVATGSIYQAIADIPAGSTARVDKVWSSSTNYTDAAGVMWEIRTTVSSVTPGYVVTASDITHSAAIPTGKVFRFIRRDIGGIETNYVYEGDDYNEQLTSHKNSYWQLEYYADGMPYVAYQQYAGELAQSLHLVHHDLNAKPSNGDWLKLSATNVYSYVTSTNAIDRTVTTNGTVIIIGQTSDDAGTITQQVARAGSQVITNSFFGKSEAEASKEFHSDSYTNLIWRTVYSNGWVWLAAYTNTVTGE